MNREERIGRVSRKRFGEQDDEQPDQYQCDFEEPGEVIVGANDRPDEDG